MPRFNPDDYVDVQERIATFWGQYPDGAINSRLMSPPDDFQQCRYEASVFKHRDDLRPSGMGYAFEIAGGTGPNQTSHEENCETSAIGRALANMGYATSRKDRPSRQEMQKVERGAAPAPVPQERPETNRSAPAALPGMANADADWLAVIGDVRDAKGLREVHAELTKANASRAVWDAYGRTAAAINSTR